MQRLALIGPTGVGKSTTARLLAQRTGLALVVLDGTRRAFLPETGYDHAHSEALKRSDFEAAIAYWENFNVHVVRRSLEIHPAGIFDFGAIHSVYRDDARLREIQELLRGFDEVVLLLPVPDPVESLEILIERGREPGMGSDVIAMWRRIIGRFITDRSNHTLQTRTVFTQGMSPDQVCDEILSEPRHTKGPGH